MISVLETLAPPATEPVTDQQAAAHLRLDTDDPSVPGYVIAARAWAENYTARALITQQLRWTVASSPPPGGWPMVGLSTALIVLPQWLSPSQIGVRPLRLPRQPVQSIDGVVAGRWGQPDTALTTDQFGTNLPFAQLHVFGGGWIGGDAHLGVTFTAGYGDTGDAVPAQIKQAILLMAAFFYEQRGDAEAVAPAAAQMLLNPYRLVTFA